MVFLSISENPVSSPQFKIESVYPAGVVIHYHFPSENISEYYGILQTNNESFIVERFIAIENVFYGTRGSVFLKEELINHFPILVSHNAPSGDFTVNFGDKKDEVQQLKLGKRLTKEITAAYHKAIPGD